MGLKEYLSGFKGEDLAVKYLKKNGYKIIARNFHSKYGEIDVVALKNEVLHFIEVKTTNGNYEAIYRLDAKKYEKILKTINFYILKNGMDCDYQLDLLCVQSGEVFFYKNISY